MGSVIQVGRADAGHSSRQHDGRESASGGAPVTICVENLSHIMAAYGVAAAKAAISAMELVLDQLRTSDCFIEAPRPGFFEISFGPDAQEHGHQIVEALLDGLSSEPVKLDDLKFHLALSCSLHAELGAGPSSLMLPPSAPFGDDALWATRYRDEMAIATEVFAAATDGRMHMNWQPARSARATAQILYHEGLARVIGSDGQFISPAHFVPALETLGLARVLDRQVVKWALDELEGFPSAVLGVNISGQSARLDGWWTSLCARLARAPEVAKRLIIEITETTALAPGAHGFVDALRKLGCRVALDDFGVGHASVSNAMTLNPDIIKIDAFFLHRAETSAQGRAMLEHLIGIAGAMAPIVIVEGVETDEQSQLASLFQSRLTGGCWQQGYHLGRGSSWRSWRYEPRVVPLRDLATVPGKFRPRDSYVGLGRTR